MAKKDEDGAAAQQLVAVDLTQLGAIIAQGIAQGIATANPREIKEGDPEYVAFMREQGMYDEFERPVYQNAYEAQARGLSADIRHKASNLKSGRYIKGRVTVEASEKQIVLKYPVKGDAMMINQSHWSSFEDLIEKIWAEMHAPVPA